MAPIRHVELVPGHAVAAAPPARQAEQAHGRGGEALERRVDAEMVFGDREVAARRLGPRLGRLVSRLSARLGGEAHREPYRIAWHRVRDIGVDIGLDLDVHETTVFDWQDWLRDHIVGKIPGA